MRWEAYQKEVQGIRAEPRVLGNSGVGDSRFNGAAEKAVQARGEQARVVKAGWVARFGFHMHQRFACGYSLDERACG